ncbi:MAG: OstA-like protein [Mucinivorans sp.]
MRQWIAAATLIVGFVLISLAQSPGVKHAQTTGKTDTTKTKSTDKESALVDYNADVMLNRGDGIIRLVGNVIFHHNGAIVQCDSALKYDESHMEFFGKVLISQDSAYIYGDRVYYDGTTSKADVFAPLIKMSRGDVTLYTYNLSFNTKSQVGVFSGGGVITQRKNLMESEHGEYNSGTNIVKFLDSVAMRSDTYLIRTDSLSYDLDAEQATFLARTYIWDHDRDFLRADWGDYYSKDSTYVFTRDAYAMTEDRELWADTMRYNTKLRQAYMLNNSQILDTVNCTLMFGDWGFYDDSTGRATMTRTPSVRGWQKPDTTARYDSTGRVLPPEKIDTSYMRADSIMLFTYEPGKSKPGVRRMLTRLDTVAVKDTMMVFDTVMLDKATPMDSLTLEANLSATTLKADTVSQKARPLIARSDTIPPKADSLVALPKFRIDTTFTVRDTVVVKELSVADTVEKERVVRAYRNVRIWNKGYQAVCDSTVSFSVDSMATMYIKPILWNENNQITATQIDMYSRNEKLDWADFTGEPFIAQQALKGDTVDFNQASGKRLRTFFIDNELHNALMTGNVLNLYYKDEEGKLETMAAISCAELNIIFVKREPTRMIWAAGEGTIYPIEKIPITQPRFLTGFSWLDTLRPKNAREICQRTERPSIRTLCNGYYKPTYAISIQIDAKKEELLKAGTWSDRVDTPSVTPDYFKEQNTLMF